MNDLITFNILFDALGSFCCILSVFNLSLIKECMFLHIMHGLLLHAGTHGTGVEISNLATFVTKMRIVSGMGKVNYFCHSQCYARTCGS